MTPEEFKKARIRDLVGKTKISKFQWSRYLSGKVFPRYETLQIASSDLNMDVPTLVACIEERVKNKVKKRIAC